MKIKHFINYIINLIYPNVCGICNKICDKNLCKKCELQLERIAKFKEDIYKDKYFRKHLYIFRYKGIIKQKLIDYKFNEQTYIYKSFVEFIIKNKKMCRFFKSYDIIIPVPIHKKRKNKRGYNQSELLAKEIANNIENLTFMNNVLYKKINNKPQSSKNREQRENDVIGVYELKNTKNILRKRILLLDDIYTTGSTVNECCKVLKKANIRCVDVITVAKD